MDLNELRDKIDNVDSELVRLFTERMELAGQVDGRPGKDGLFHVVSLTLPRETTPLPQSLLERSCSFRPSVPSLAHPARAG